MTILFITLLVIANLLLGDFIGRQTYETVREWWTARQLVSGHPEMEGVDLANDELIHFSADDEVRALVLGNNEPAGNTPFLGDSFILDEEGF